MLPPPLDPTTDTEDVRDMRQCELQQVEPFPLAWQQTCSSVHACQRHRNLVSPSPRCFVLWMISKTMVTHKQHRDASSTPLDFSTVLLSRHDPDSQRSTSLNGAVSGWLKS